MGMLTESGILNQAKKGQGETNARLDRLIMEQQETNRLLALLVAAASRS